MPLLDLDRERIIAQTNAALWNLHDQGVIRMGYEMEPQSGDETTRLPWKMAMYELRLLDVEEKPNKFYNPEPHEDSRTGEMKPGDKPLFEKNLSFKFEVVKGEKKGDWLFVNFVSKYLRVLPNGEIKGRLGEIAHALNPTLDLSGKWNVKDDLINAFCLGSAKPKENGKYADITAWGESQLSNVEKAEISGIKLTEVKKDAPKADDNGIGEEDIPF